MRNNIRILLFILLFLTTQSYTYGQDEEDKQAAQGAVEETKSEIPESEETAKKQTDFSQTDKKKNNEIKKEGTAKEIKPLPEKVKKGFKDAGFEKEPAGTGQIFNADDKPAFDLNDSVLQIPLGDSVQERIPGIKLKKEDNDDIVSIPDDKAKGSDEKDKSKGLFGMSESISEIVTKGSIILLILFIIVLYRMRSRGPGRR